MREMMRKQQKAMINMMYGDCSMTEPVSRGKDKLKELLTDAQMKISKLRKECLAERRRRMKRRSRSPMQEAK